MNIATTSATDSFMDKVADALKHLDIDLERPMVNRSWGDSQFSAGVFKGFSINTLVEYWAQQKGAMVTWLD